MTRTSLITTSILFLCILLWPSFIHAQINVTTNGKTQTYGSWTDAITNCPVSSNPIPESGWVINTYDTKLHVTSDGTLQVTEQINVNFEVKKHGIYRYIPLVFQPQGDGFDMQSFSLLDVSGVQVTLNGSSTLYRQSTRKSSQCVRSILGSLVNEELFLKIGDPDVTISGPHTYKITYIVGKALRTDRGKVELYWNAIPHAWGVPIETASIDLTSDIPFAPEVYCYHGAVGMTTNCRQDRFGPQHIRFATDRLDEFSGATLLIAFSTDPSTVAANIDTPWTWMRYMSRYPWELLGILPGLLALWLKYTKGRDPASRGIIAPRYDAPGGMSAAQVGIVADQTVNDVDISSVIIALAVKGHLLIKKIEGGFLGIGEDYEFTVKTGKTQLTAEEQIMLDGIFSSGEHTVTLSSLKYSFTPTIDTIKTNLQSWGVHQGIFKHAPIAGNAYFLTFFLSLIGCLIFGIFVNVSIIFWMGFGIAVIIVIIVIATFRFYTEKGKAMQEEVMGLKMYMETAEKDRISFLNAPEKTPQLFERLLPYAMALGVVDIWSTQFEGLLKEPPSWYVGPHHGAFIPTRFSQDINSAASSFASTMTAVKSSSSGGGGGGGFSGGGGGGGGGGSW